MANVVDKDRLVNEIDAAKYLGVSHRTLQNWRIRGGGPRYVKIGQRTVRYRVRELDAWIEELSCGSTSQY